MICARRSLFFMLELVVGIALFSPTASAQVATGAPPFGTFGGGPEVINLGNLNVQYTIPIRHKTGRGNNFAWDLTYNSSVWTPVGNVGNQAWALASGWAGLNPFGLSYITYSMTYTSGQCGYQGQSSYQEWSYGNFYYYDQYGVSTSFGGGGAYFSSPGGGTCPPNGMDPPTVEPVSANGYTLYASFGEGTATGYLIDKTGTTFYPPMNTSPPAQDSGVVSADNNSNTITVNNGVFTDTLNTTVLSVIQATNTNFIYAAPSGANATIAVSYKSYVVRSNFGCSNVTEYNAARTIQSSLIDRVTLPDGSYYQFNYETTYQDTHTPHDVTSRLASVTLPSGGTISYLYATGGTGVNGISCSDGTTTTLVRTTPDTGSNSWTYARSQVSGAHWTTTVTDPAANQTVIDFQADGTAGTGNFYETQRKAYQGSTSGTLLDTVTTCYNTNTSNCSTTAVASPITQQNVTTQLGTSTLQSLRVSKFNTYGLPTEEDDYDYANGTPTVILKKSFITYASVTGIADLPAAVTVCSATGTSSSCNGAGTPVAQTTYTYDQGTLTTSSGTPQHNCAVNGCRGNVTTIASLVQGATTLNKTFTYYDTGMIKTITGVNGKTTTFNYPDPNSTCGNTFFTSTTLPITTPQLSTSATWNCAGGVQLTSVDANGQATTTAYSDPDFWRPASVTDSTGAATNLTYATSSPYNWTESKMTFNSGNSVVDRLATADGLGRVHLLQTRQGPSASNYDSVETDYDSLGRVSRLTLPYNGTSGQTNSTAPAATTTYDALNRPLTVTDGGGGTKTSLYTQNDVLVTRGPAPAGENTKKAQFEFDALGRLTSVCEITSGTTAWPSGNCAQNLSQTGYWTQYTYDQLDDLLTATQNAQAIAANRQARTYSFDAVKRLTSEKNPETNQVAISYTYDADAACTPSSVGDLVKRVDAVGNTTCFTYDGLHRKTGITYPSGNYAANTPSKTFVYDSATVNGLTMQNVKGRLAEAFTGPSGAKTTDLGFSYTTRGEASDVYELTPHSNGSYYHVAQSYWPQGSIFQLSSNIAGLPTINYGGSITAGLDGEGRIVQVTATGTGQQSPVTNVVYNNSSLPTQVNFGSGDSDNFTYDSNTLRMTQFKFNVGASSQSLTGTLTWNSNGTLGQLALTDQFNSSDTQICNYLHDDLVRIASANCGSAAAQTFSYDPFGNISKSGSPYSFQASYSVATNRITLLPGNFVPTYDANGNVTNDSNHVYSWDADGNSLTIDSVGLAFDAFDRLVEQNRSGTYTEVVYSPGGKKLALMGGQTLQKAFVPLPRQSVAIYTSNGLDHYRHADWLGSGRLTSTPSRTFSSSAAYAPFGEPYAQAGAADLSFTEQNQDSVAGDYDFPNREYSIQGRWPSPDPAGISAVSTSNPQSWNRYSYVLNNPLSSVDPLGYECVWDDGSFDAEDDPSTGSVGGCQSAGGTWIELGQLGNWTATKNPQLGALAGQIQSGLVGVVAAVGLDGLVYGTGYNGNGTVSWTELGGTQWVNVYSYDIMKPFGSQNGGYADPNGAYVTWAWKIVQAFGTAIPTTVNPDDVNSILLQQTLEDTGVQSLGNACTPAAFYWASAPVKIPAIPILTTAMGDAGYNSVMDRITTRVQAACTQFGQ